MNDSHIRLALRRKLYSQYSEDPATLIVDELSLNNGEVRADVAVINSLLRGYELKSDIDSLERLPHQVRGYNAVFDYVTLVVGYRHAYEAVKIIPEWWGLTLVEMTLKEHVRLIAARNARRNSKLDKMALARLLWREEAIAILDQSGMATGIRFKSKDAIYERIVENVDINVLRLWVCQQLRLRTNWRVDATQIQYDG